MELHRLVGKGFRVLALGAHPDDVEWGAGGTVSHLSTLGASIRIIAASRAEISVANHLSPSIMVEEAAAAAEVLTDDRTTTTIWEYPTRTLSDHRQAILERYVQLRKEFQPQLVLVPTREDKHQDHQVVQTEAHRAFSHVTILGYELPWNSHAFVPGVFIALGEAAIDRKKRALTAYESQGGRSYMDPTLVESVARMRGAQCGSRYAEAFEAIQVLLRE